MSTLQFSELDEVAPGWEQNPSTVLAEALEGLRRGAPVVVTHGECGFLAVGATITAAGLAALVRHGSGLIYAAMPEPRLRALQIPRMPTDSDSLCPRVHVAVDAAVGVTTGISAADRAVTISRLGDPASTPADFHRPGHVLPVSADSRLGAAPADADLALALANMADAGAGVAAFCALVSVARPAELADRQEAAVIAATCGLSVVDSGEITNAYYRWMKP